MLVHAGHTGQGRRSRVRHAAAPAGGYGGPGFEGEPGLGEEPVDEGGPVLDAFEPVLDDRGELVKRLELRVAELERRLRMDSRNSSTPPSKEPLAARARRKAAQRASQRERSKHRKPGGQPGHAGSGLEPEADPDRTEQADPPPSAAAAGQAWAAPPRAGAGGRCGTSRRCGWRRCTGCCPSCGAGAAGRSPPLTRRTGGPGRWSTGRTSTPPQVFWAARATSGGLGGCWAQHPLCLYTLDWLHELWSVLYLTRRRTPATLAGQAEFQTRLLPAAAAQMAAETSGCGHRPRPGRSGTAPAIPAEATVT
jgi:hypothetical protein